jgi:hypothetical protein
MQVEVGGHNLDFFDCFEVCQGGPQACRLSIDGWPIEGRKFDPSPLIFEETILLPMRKISFFKSGYVLVQIDPRNYSIKGLSGIHNYMKLKAIKERTVEFRITSWGEETVRLNIP